MRVRCPTMPVEITGSVLTWLQEVAKSDPELHDAAMDVIEALRDRPTVAMQRADLTTGPGGSFLVLPLWGGHDPRWRVFFRMKGDEPVVLAVDLI